MFFTLIMLSGVLSENAIATPFNRMVFAMGTSLEISIQDQPREQALKISEQALKIILTKEHRLSTWIPDSELSKINSSKSNEAIALSPLLAEDLKSAFQCAQESDGAFDPALAPLVSAWGLRTGGRIPSLEELIKAKQNSGKELFTLTHHQNQNITTLIKKQDSAGLEEGGFGKGAALDDVIAYFKKQGVKNAVLDFGGQLAILSDQAKKIGIADPSHRDETLVELESGTMAIATSSNSVHQNKVTSAGKTKKLGHLLNPFTGEPTAQEGSITVMHPQAFKADCYTKVFVLGVDRALKWANQHGEKIMLITPALKTGHWNIITSCAWNAPLHFNSKMVTRMNSKYCKKGQEKQS